MKNTYPEVGNQRPDKYFLSMIGKMFSFLDQKIKSLTDFFSIKKRSKEEKDLLRICYLISIVSLIVIVICIMYLWHNYSKKYDISFYEKPINYVVLGNFYDGYDTDSIQKLILYYTDIREREKIMGNVVEIKGSAMGDNDFCKYYGILLEYGAKEKERGQYSMFYIQSESFFRVSIHNNLQDKNITETEIEDIIIQKTKEEERVHRNISIKKYYADKIVLEYPVY